MDQCFSGMPVQCYLDDLLITGRDDEEHLANLKLVLGRIQELGLTLNKEKCAFMKDSTEYCGHIITKERLQQSPRKVEAIAQMPQPQNITQLRAFIDMVQYYAKFVPNLSHRLHSLLQLLLKGRTWHWGRHQQECFDSIKEELKKDNVLTHYNQEYELTLACDSSAYGLGAVLSHVMPDGSERPIAYASRTLNNAEKNYAQIEREALALVWGTRKFYQYLLGRQFTLITDHQPLKFIMSSAQGVSAIAAARIQSWSLYLSQFSYDIKYRATGKHSNSDGLSRLPLSVTAKEDDQADVFIVKQLQYLPVTVEDVAMATRQDTVLSQVMKAVRSGSNLPNTDVFQPYRNWFQDLVISQQCLTWNMRVVVPTQLQQYVLNELATQWSQWSS